MIVCALVSSIAMMFYAFLAHWKGWNPVKVLNQDVVVRLAAKPPPHTHTTKSR